MSAIDPRTWKWRWILFQVAVPLLGPIVVSALVAAGWETGQPTFHMDMKVIFDVTPWALIFFTMALLGSGFYDVWADLYMASQFSIRSGKRSICSDFHTVGDLDHVMSLGSAGVS